MADKIELEIVTPDRRVVAEQVDEVVLPSAEGYMGILPGHAPLLALMDIGEVSYRVGGQRHYLVVTGGFAEVLRNSVSILARTCEKADEIDEERAEKAKQRASSEIEAKADEQAFRKAEVHLKRALSRLRVRDRIRG